jgi:16S rRNA (guanine527-N7)-methyltransferase
VGRGVITTEFGEMLVDGAKRLGLALEPECLARLETHRVVLERWADKTNLTTIRDPVGMVERLYLDSLVLVPYLENSVSVHDVGTGAGFPGLVIKAALPRLKVTLTEARRKKVSFLKSAAREMNVEGGLEIRWERLGWNAPSLAHWEEVMSRAALPPREWLAAGAGLVAPGGRIWVLLGAHDASEGAEDPESPKGFVRESRMIYHHPFTGTPRALLSYRRK